MIFRSFLIFLTCFLTQPSYALITINGFGPESYSRAEGRFFGDPTLSTNIIYGGVSGTCSGPLSSTSVCNSCASAASTSACNTRRIHDDLLFQVSFISDTAGQVLVTDDVNPGQSQDGQTTLDFSGYAPGVVVPANTAITIEIRWNEICRKIFGAASCAETADFGTTTRRRIRIGIDAGQAGGGGIPGNPNPVPSIGDGQLQEGEFSNEIEISIAKLSGGETPLCIEGDDSTTPVGACNFIAFPGDGKVFIENVRTDCQFPAVTNSSGRIQALRVYYQLASENESPDKSQASKDLLIGDTAQGCVAGVKSISLRDNEVDGLQNGSDYRFAVGVVDEALNVGLLTQHNGALPADDTSGCYNTEDWNFNCHLAKPQEVFGLIQDEFDCFITTAAFGSPFQEKVRTFRAFRNRYLKSNFLGRKIIQLYYKNSPPLAAWIRQSESRKIWTQRILWPFWALAHISLHYPLLLIMTFLISFFGLISFRKARSS